MKSPSRLFAISVAVACLATCCLGASAAQAATTKWAPLAASGPTNLPPVQSEVQRAYVNAEGGTFALTAYHAVAHGTGDLVGENTKTVKSFQIKSGTFVVGQPVVGDFIPPGTTIAAVGADTLTLSQASTSGIENRGVDVFAVDVSATTPPLPFDADTSQVEGALNALSSIGGVGGSITVKGGLGGPKGSESPYIFSFGGSLADANQPALVADAGALSGVEDHTATITTTLNGGPGSGKIAIYAQNIGGLVSSGTTTITLDLPPGVTTSGTPGVQPGNPNSPPITPPFSSAAWSCLPVGAGQSTVTCTTDKIADPGYTLPNLTAPVVVGPGAQSGIVHVEVSGGGAVGTAEYDMPLTISAIPAQPGLQSFSAGAYDDDGLIDTRAGAHPYSGSAGILINTKRTPSGDVVPAGEFRDIVVDLPPGFLGNPIATPQCSESLPKHYECDPRSIVATVQIPFEGFATTGAQSTVNNIEAPNGYPAKFRFVTGNGFVIINVVGGVRSDEDYGLEVGSINTPQLKPVFGSFFTFWGSPADETHDALRCQGYEALETPPKKCATGGDEVAFLSSPTDCAEEAVRTPITRVNINTWQNPGLLFSYDVPIEPVTECDKLKFEADFTFEPSDTKSDSPASFRTELTVPSEGLTDPDELMTPTIRETVVDLPKGVVLNASAADGLGACSKAQIGLMGTNFPPPNRIRFSKAPQTCPDNSKIGSGELKSELLEDPLQGDLYLAAQGDGNPFGSLFAIYLVIEDPRHGIFIKLPGEVQVSNSDGQQRIVFRDLPQLPFTYLRLNLKGGNRSPLASPPICGKYVTTTTNTPWSYPESGAPTTSANGFEINQGPNGGACSPTMASRPFNLGLKAGTDGIGAGAFSPLTFQITRPDGAQEIDTLELTTAKGLAASLRGIPNCPESSIASASGKTGQQELSSPACPGASQIGRTLVGSGSGPTPFYSGGKLYLAGPYKGAPLSVVAITPAVAGPFDLGNVVVRTAVFLNRSTAQVTAKADPIPQILKGVPLRIRDVRVILDRPGFSLNPTSCDASQIDVKVTGNSGAVSNLSNRFQVAGCQDLAFKPKFTGKVIGGTKRGDHPKFTAEVEWPQGAYANTKDVAVTLPRSEFLDQANIRTICTRVQAAANQCPAGAIYGEAEAFTPLLDEPLKGPVFLKSSDNKLPDLAIKLRGPDSKPIEVEFQGRIDSIGGRIRNTIEGLPDVPVSKFVLRMQGGSKGLLVNSRNLCTTKKVKMEVHALGQNNKRSDQNPVLGNSCKKSQLKKAARKAKRKAQRAHRRQAG